MIHLVPAFQDNYIFIVEANGHAMVVDPGDAAPVLDFLARSNLILDLIVATHHHPDHSGGIADLKEHHPKSKILGPSSLAAIGIEIDRVLHEGDFFQFGNREWQTLYVPGHTLDHLAFFAHDVGIHSENRNTYQAPVLFCGDVLFSFGCGRLFEGTFAQMFGSLAKLKNLPPDTRVYCAHEYTLNNLDFTIDYLRRTHDDRSIAPYLQLREQLAERRRHGRPTVPITIDSERHHNLFLRAHTVEEFTAVRTARNGW